MDKEPKTVYCYNNETKIFTSRQKSYYNETAQSHLLPANSTLVEIPESIGGNQSALFDPENESWSIVDDYRGIVYHTETQLSKTVDTTGALEADYTELEPQSKFDVFDGKQWVFSETKKLASLKKDRSDSIYSEYHLRKSKITATVKNETFTGSQEDDILKLVSLINENIIPDGEAMLSNLSDEPKQIKLFKVDLLELGKQIAVARLSLSAQRNQKLADDSEPTDWK